MNTMTHGRTMDFENWWSANKPICSEAEEPYLKEKFRDAYSDGYETGYCDGMDWGREDSDDHEK